MWIISPAWGDFLFLLRWHQALECPTLIGEHKMVITIQGLKIVFDDIGQGIPILFIHGFPLNRSLWDQQTGNLSPSYRIISVDLRGHGDSQPIPGPYSMEMLADDCRVLLDALHIELPVYICGLSMGGYISLAFYRLFASRVAGLILAATRAGADTVEAQANRDKAISLVHQQGTQAIADSMLPKMFAPKTYQSNPILVNQIRLMMTGTSMDGISGALTGMKNRVDSTPILSSIRAPTLIIHGEDDQLIPLSVAKDMNSSIPNSKLLIMPGAGHLLNLEQPEFFNQAISDFVTSHTPFR
jgi:3-oxoadipate enol-lactonase